MTPRNIPEFRACAMRPWSLAVIGPPEIVGSKRRRKHVHRRNSKSRCLVREEARGLHQLFVALFLTGDPFDVLGAGHEALVERAIGHQLLPLRRLTWSWVAPGGMQ